MYSEPVFNPVHHGANCIPVKTKPVNLYPVDKPMNNLLEKNFPIL